LISLLQRNGMQGQLMWRRRQTNEYGCILLDMVPVRPPGYRFSPIIHVAHYYSPGQVYENYTWFLNLCRSDEGESSNNRLLVDYYGRSGQRLGSATLELPRNTSVLVPIEEKLHSIGVAQTTMADGVTAHYRGGASQFAIFVVTRNRMSGAIGFEHSLPPYYYVRAIGNPETRSRIYRSATIGL